MPELNVVDIKGKKAASVELPKEQFGVHVHDAVIHQAVVMYNANQRQGNANTKTRSDVSGGGKKPWAQKGTGRARQGSTRSPLWKKGGIAFGPQTSREGGVNPANQPQALTQPKRGSEPVCRRGRRYIPAEQIGPAAHQQHCHGAAMPGYCPAEN